MKRLRDRGGGSELWRFSMATPLRTIGAIAVAMIVGCALFVGVELFSEFVHLFPTDVEKTEAEVCRHVARYPAWELAVAGGVAWSKSRGAPPAAT